MMHYSVMLKECIDYLKIKEDGLYVDATMGYAGHSKQILKRVKRGFLFAFDADRQAINYSSKILDEVGKNYKIFHTNFVNMKKTLEDENVTKVDGILFDLGFSSPQVDNKERGFSFMNDGSLDMRMNQDEKITAKMIVNNYSEEELSKLFFMYGEEKLSKIIAKNIIAYRKTKEIESTLELVEIIKAAVGSNYFYKQHPERKIFQAIRIEVNNEIKVLESILPEAIEMLNIGGRICVITFHSLEDRVVKNIFKKYSDIDEKVKGLPIIPDEYKPKSKLVNKKPIIATDEELNENTRSKSAKLRVIERIN